MKKRWISCCLLLSVMLMACGHNAAAQPVPVTEEETQEEPVEEEPQEQNEQEMPAPEEVFSEEDVQEELSMGTEVIAVRADYPEQPGEGGSAGAFMEGDAYWNWLNAYRAKADTSMGLQGDMDLYYDALLKEMFSSTGDENMVCSPLNIYIATAMLSETTDGAARRQILDALHAGTQQELRSRVKALWEANYAETPTAKSLLADSLWMRNDMTYNQDTLQTLADDYFASAFYGPMGSEQMNEALRNWTDENTGGLLKDFTQGLHMDADTAMALISTIYYKASWADKFPEAETVQETFRGTRGDVQVSMMHRQGRMTVYDNGNFLAVSLPLNDIGEVLFFLPQEGMQVQDLLRDGTALRLARGKASVNEMNALVNLAVPKFRVQQKTDLLGTLSALGVTDVLYPGVADFTPLTEEARDIYLSQAEHAALFEADEEGVTGAAYTAMMMALGAMPPEDEEIIDFVLDRPFLFLVRAHDDSILFAGAVQNIG